MIRTALAFAFAAIVGLVALKVAFGVLGGAIGLLFALGWFALKLGCIGAAVYFALSIVSPESAARVRGALGVGGTPRPS